MLRLCRVFLVVTAIAAVTAASAAAVPHRQRFGQLLGDMWTTTIQTPASGDPCRKLGANIVAPFNGGKEFTCIVKPGTKVFVAAYSAECSTVELAPYYGADENAMRSCASKNVAELEPISATLDGRPIALTHVQTALLNFVLPPDNILNPKAAAGTTGQSVGAGPVALLHPLTPGSHEIKIFYGDQLAITTVKVQPGARRTSGAR
jgi:hypothetical protein